MTDIGKLRRSTLASTFGPGAIVDFRAGDATVSGIVAGLEEWDRNFPPPGTANPQSTYEPRLIKKLMQRGHAITGFRLPPTLTDREIESRHERLVAVEFPRWHQCPACDLVGPGPHWAQRPGSAARYCPACSRSRDVHVVPVRFVMACDLGHVDDFPWHFWVGHAEGCRNRRFLKLESVGAGLGGLRLSCLQCQASRSMEGIFAEQTWQGFRCDGRRPWLAAADEACDHGVRAVQRGATNIYFPVTLSSLDIPPWSDVLQQQLGQYWSPIVESEGADGRAMTVRVLANSVLKPALEALRMTPEELTAEIERRMDLLARTEDEDLRVEEYRQFALGQDTPREQAGQFEIRVVSIPETLRPWIGRVVRAVRLREVRALTGFTRILPPGDDPQQAVASLSASPLTWLPAVEVFGEGIFLDLDADRLTEWERRPEVRARAGHVARRWQAEYRARYGSELTWSPPARFLLVHTLAHALMRQLTLDCGYSTSSLRERLFVGEGIPGAGLLVYTSTTDADGTLGGLQRQGLPDRIRRTLPAAISAMEWCSSDPLCIEGIMSAPEMASGATCHACVLAPETACEHFNRFLDRALLVGSPAEPDVGFFRGLLDGG